MVILESKDFKRILLQQSFQESIETVEFPAIVLSVSGWQKNPAVLQQGLLQGITSCQQSWGAIVSGFRVQGLGCPFTCLGQGFRPLRDLKI